MQPGAISLNAPTAPTGLDYYAIASEYEPAKAEPATVPAARIPGGVQVLEKPVSAKARLTNLIMGGIFQEVANDLVVPTEGVYGQNGNPNFPIARERRLLFAPEYGVTHVNFFEQLTTSATLLDWLKA